MALTCTIGGVPYVIIENNGSPVPGYTSSGSSSSSSGSSGIAGGSDSGYQQTNNAQERQRWQCDIMDYTGTAHFSKGEQVVVTDPVLGILFQGFINSDKALPIYPSGIVRHSIDCVGLEDIPSRRTYTATYSTSQLAGKIAVDMLNNVLLPEGIVQNFAEHTDNSTADFNTGILSGTQGVTDANGNQWLELAQAGQNTVITENTTALFSTGTLTNVQAVNNQLLPTTVSGLKLQAALPFDQTTAFLELLIWSGSYTLGGSEFLNYTIFISSTSPAYNATLILNFSDATTMAAAVDQNNYADYAATNLETVAKDTWYVRRFSLSSFSGKTVTQAVIILQGPKAGSYTVYYQNAYLDSGTVFFATNATTTQTNPVQTLAITNYPPASVIVSVIPVVNPSVSTRISPNYNIDPVKLVSSSSVSWVSGGSSGAEAAIYASYDGGVTYVQCTNNAALPALLGGSNVAGSTLTLKETFTIGSNPEIIPTLSNVQISIYSAPSATKSDIITPFATQTEWNTGTFTGLTATSGGDLTMGTIVSPWLSNSIANQTFFYGPSNSTTVTQSISSHTYNVNVKVTSSANQAGIGRLDWAGTIATTNGISIEFDITVPSTNNFSSVMLIQYLQTYWYSSSGEGWGPGAYTFWFQQSGISNNCILYKGTNSSTDSPTNLVQATVGSNPTHVKITVSSAGVHNIYLNGSGTPTLTVTDTTYTQGQIGVGGWTYFQSSGSGQTADFKFSNAAITPNTTTNGTWQGPATSINSLGTVENSVIYWTEVGMGANAAAYIQTSVDGGTSFQTCTNGGSIPNLTPGTSTAGLSVQLYIWMVNNVANLPLPIIRQLSWRVLGAYPGSSGTRSTVPLGNDTMVRGNVTGSWGTAFDSQTYTKVGTGTTNLTSNEGTIANTTGDVHMVLGSRTWTDEDGTVRFQLSASTISAGIELRYTDANNFYRLQASTTAVSIIKVQSGVSTTLASVSMTINTGTYYRMRFRVTGATQPLLQGNVWLSGNLEPTISATTGQWNNNLWTIQVYE